MAKAVTLNQTQQSQKKKLNQGSKEKNKWKREFKQWGNNKRSLTVWTKQTHNKPPASDPGLSPALASPGHATLVSLSITEDRIACGECLVQDPLQVSLHSRSCNVLTEHCIYCLIWNQQIELLLTLLPWPKVKNAEWWHYKQAGVQLVNTANYLLWFSNPFLLQLK